MHSLPKKHLKHHPVGSYIKVLSLSEGVEVHLSLLCPPVSSNPAVPHHDPFLHSRVHVENDVSRSAGHEVDGDSVTYKYSSQSQRHRTIHYYRLLIIIITITHTFLPHKEPCPWWWVSSSKTSLLGSCHCREETENHRKKNTLNNVFCHCKIICFSFACFFAILTKITISSLVFIV